MSSYKLTYIDAEDTMVDKQYIFELDIVEQFKGTRQEIIGKLSKVIMDLRTAREILTLTSVHEVTNMNVGGEHERLD